MIQYFRNFMKYLLLIVVITGITMVSMYVAVIRDYQPSYESTTSLLVSRKHDVSGGYEAYVLLQEVTIAEKIVSDIPELVFSTTVRQEVNNVLKDKLPDATVYDEATFRNNIKTEIVTDSRVVNVSVRHHDPETARLVAKTIARTTDQIIMDLTRQNFIQVISTAEKPRHPIGLREDHLWVLSILGGFLLGMGLVLIFTISEKYTVTPIKLKIPDIPDIRAFLKKDKKTR